MKLYFQGVLCSLFAFLGACAHLPWTGGADPIVVTQIELQADPWRYHDKKVKITGEFDECAVIGCSICDLTGVEKKNGAWYVDECIGVAFGKDDLQHSPYSMASIARYTTSTIEATYNAFCANAKPAHFVSTVQYNGKEKLTVCHGPQAELLSARIVKVHQQRPARDGLTRLFAFPLIKPGPGETEKLYAAFDKSMSSFLRRHLGQPDKWRKFAFLYGPSANEEHDAPEQTGGVCVCMAFFDECKGGAWEPQHSGQVIFKSEVDMYTCYRAENYDGEWNFTLFP